MGMYGGFYKGEKKKKKKGGVNKITAVPVFTPPQVIPKGKVR